MPTNHKTNTRRKQPVSKHRVRYQNTLHDLQQMHYEAINNLAMLRQAVKSATDKENILVKLTVEELRSMKGVVEKLQPIVREANDQLKEIGNELSKPPAYVHKDDKFQLDFSAWSGTLVQRLSGQTTVLIGEGLAMLPEIYGVLDRLADAESKAQQPEGTE